LFGLVGGIVIVRRRSTGEERLYATGQGSAWLGTLLMDFGAWALRDSGAPVVAGRNRRVDGRSVAGSVIPANAGSTAT